MENSPSSPSSTSSTPWAIIGAIVVVVVIAAVWFLNQEEPKEPVVIEPPKVEQPDPVVEETVEETPEPVVEELPPPPEPVVVEHPEPPKPMLPTLSESDDWLKEKLPTITWRKELLKLVVDDDMIRRFVVFTDNFSQGVLAYEHSPLIKPSSSFTAKEINQNGEVVMKWDETTTRRFSLYVDLLRTVDTDTLVDWYFELKPLVDEAYRELGYQNEDFTDILQDAITKVLDMEIPKERLELERPSVMYQFKDQEYESLDDADKLMLRLGKDNLLVIKSVLLEISEKLARAREEQGAD